MNEEMKFYLLAEESGWNMQEHALNFGQKLKDSDNYKKLVQHVDEAKEHLSYKAKGIIDSFQRLDFYTMTIKDCFLLETSFDYLYLHSFPEYYLNPLAVHPNYQGEVNSIGDLIIDFDGEDKTINEIILDESKSKEYKMARIDPRLDYYLSDMTKIADTSIKNLKKEAITKKHFKSNIFSIAEIIFFILVNVFMFFTWIYPFTIFFDHFYKPVYTHALTYLAYMYPMLVLLFDIIFVAFHVYKANINEAYNYAKRFLKRNPDKLFDDIAKRKEELKNYIEGAIYAKISLKNDIHDFSCLSEAYVDLKAVADNEKIKNRTSYKVLNALRYSTITLTGIGFVIFLIIYIIAVVFQVSL